MTQKNASKSKYILIFISVTFLILITYYLLFSASAPMASSLIVPLSNEYDLLMIADRDEFSWNEKLKVWESVLHTALLKRNTHNSYEYHPLETKMLSHELVRKDRGLELSELKFFSQNADDDKVPIESEKRRLLAFGDRTGIVYEVVNWKKPQPKLIPRAIVAGGNGRTETKPFKNEWATVKDNQLIVGSWGKEFTSRDGTEIISEEQMMYVKVFDRNMGLVEHRDWIKNFQKVRQSVGIQFPGYLVHEAVEWSNLHKKWYFLPRRVSKQKYDDAEDLQRGGNILIAANEDFSKFESYTIKQETKPTRGFSSIKFVPGTNDQHLVALKTEENGSDQHSYITVVDISGNVLLPETYIGKEKYEGVEIVYRGD
uniref:Apyrase n=1 Tax=Percolomonas cosmopolitus TaxID=63605 RepID=A0A7S1PIM2_9EUKA